MEVSQAAWRPEMHFNQQTHCCEILSHFWKPDFYILAFKCMQDLKTYPSIGNRHGCLLFNRMCTVSQAQAPGCLSSAPISQAFKCLDAGSLFCYDTSPGKLNVETSRKRWLSGWSARHASMRTRIGSRGSYISQTWTCVSIILALGRWKQMDLKLLDQPV